MDSKKLEILMTAADLGSFTKASEVVGYTQSGLTHMMDALEKEVGFPLIVKPVNLGSSVGIPARRGLCSSQGQCRPTNAIHEDFLGKSLDRPRRHCGENRQTW